MKTLRQVETKGENLVTDKDRSNEGSTGKATFC